MKMSKKEFNADELLKNAVPPETRRDHVVDDLMKFWDKAGIFVDSVKNADCF